jgi:DNA-binding response OmpR family regulator
MALQAGFDHHLTKPAEPDELLSVIERWQTSRMDPSRNALEPGRLQAVDGISQSLATTPLPGDRVAGT